MLQNKKAGNPKGNPARMMPMAFKLTGVKKATKKAACFVWANESATPLIYHYFIMCQA
jgi:hypothetical protein